MQTLVTPIPSLSPTVKAVLAAWLAQAPVAPRHLPPGHQALCLRLAKSAKGAVRH